MAVSSTGAASGAAAMNAQQFQAMQDVIEAKSMQNTLDKENRDVNNAYVSGYQNSITTMVSSEASDKIQF